MSYKDYYEILGIERGATQEAIQKAFRAIARKNHPDVNKDPKAEERFKAANEAHEVLHDPEKRRLYDQYGSAWKAISEGRQPPPGSERVRFDFGQQGAGFQGVDPNDLGSIFEQFFSGGMAGGMGGGMPGMGGIPGMGGRGSRRPRARAGADAMAKLELGVAEAFAGGMREIGLTAGDGTTSRVSLKVPPGVRPGQKIRLSGKGGEGSLGGPAGDLYLEVDIVSDERFSLDGDDVILGLSVAPWEAALGATIAVATLDGEVRLKVPPGSSTGRRIRLKERGYPKAGGARGDLFVEVRIAVPSELTDEERRLFEELAKASKFDPRG